MPNDTTRQPFSQSQTPSAIIADQLQRKRNQLTQREGWKNPPYCNTGGYENPAPKISNTHLSDLETNLTTIDWLRLTNTNLEAFTATLNELQGEDGILSAADLDIRWQQKGMHGYEQSAAIMIWRDNDYLTVGHIVTIHPSL